MVPSELFHLAGKQWRWDLTPNPAPPWLRHEEHIVIFKKEFNKSILSQYAKLCTRHANEYFLSTPRVAVQPLGLTSI